MAKEKIDFHGHYFPPEYKKLLQKYNITSPDGFPMPTWSEEEHLSDMDKLNITYSVISISSPHLNFGDDIEAAEVARASNEYGCNFASRYPDRIGVLASLPLPNVEKTLEEISHINTNNFIKGFAIPTNTCGIYLGDERLDSVFEELDRINAVVAIHPTSPSSVPENVNKNLPLPIMEFFFDTTRAVTNMILNNTFIKYPNIKFIIPHAGAFIPILSDRLASFSHIFSNDKDLDIFSQLSNLYYDLSGFSLPKQYDVLKKIVSCENILYGSDGPFTPLIGRIKLSQILDSTDKISSNERELIYSINPRRILK